MEWLLFNFVIFFPNTVHAKTPNYRGSTGQTTTPLPGVCRVPRRIYQNDLHVKVMLEICCNNFYRSNGVCVECPTGFYSRGGQTHCKKCGNGFYGKRCRFVCRCNSTERCDNEKGCLPIDAIAKREIILYVVITSFGLLIVGGLVYMRRKRQSRIVITQHQEEIKADTCNSRSKMQIQLIEEGSENVYDIIDESALSKTLEPSTSKMQNSYLDVMYSPKIPMNVEDNLGVICIASVSSQSKMAHKTSLRRQQGGLEEKIISCQGALVSAYSDGYLRPRSFEHHTGINKMMEKQGTFCSNKDKVARKENYGYIYDEPAYVGIGRAGNYDSLVFSKDTSNLKNEIVLVQNPIETEQLGSNIKSPKHTTSSPKRKTI